jgi:hypothetical protein
MQITAEQLQALEKLRDNVARTVDQIPDVKLGTLLILERRGLILAKPGPRSSTRWQIKPEGQVVLGTST